MLRLKCPYCQLDADETELSPGGEAHIRRRAMDSTDAEFTDYLFRRRNPRDVHVERWRHSFGCGKWFIAARCTLTQEVFATYKAQWQHVPKSVLDAIDARRPGSDLPKSLQDRENQ